MEQPLMSVAEVAAYLKLTEETVRRMARNGSIPSIKAARRVRFNLDDVRQHLGAK